MTSTDAHTEDALKSFYLIGIVLAATCLANIISTKKWNVYFPESGAAMVFGIIIGAIMEILRMAQIQNEFRFESETFYFILLPPIIFEAGYNMKKKDFFLNMVTILFYAVLGTLISTLVIGYGLYAVANIGLIKSISSSDMLAFLQFGALISATDPVATLSIMGSPELRVNPLVYSLIFGESVLNDAIAIVLFRTFNDFTGTTFTPIDALIALGQFCLISLGSIVIGLGVGLIAAIILKHVKHLRDEPYMEVSIVVSLAYASYLLAEVAGMSGVMSLFLSGICMKHYAWYNMSEPGQVTTDQFFKMLAFLSETFVFVYVGMNVFGYTSELKWDPLFIFWATLFIFIARVFNIVPMSFLANIRRKTKITWRMQVMLWFAGLRGAIAFSLAQTVESSNRPVIITTTLFIVLFTTLVLGPLTAPVLKKLKLQQELHPDDTEHSEALLLQSVDLSQPDSTENIEAVPPVQKNMTAFHRFWRKFDDKIMKPLVGGKPRLNVQ